jgi:hypothetical protein
MEKLTFKKLKFEDVPYIKNGTKEIYYDTIPHGFIFKIVDLETKEETLCYASTIKNFLEESGFVNTDEGKDPVSENPLFTNFIGSSYR